MTESKFGSIQLEVIDTATSLSSLLQGLNFEDEHIFVCCRLPLVLDIYKNYT